MRDSLCISLQDELKAALQYSPTPGLPGLVEQLKALQTREHKPRYNEWAVSVSGGSQDCLTKAMEMLVKPGDNVLVDNPTYSGALAFLQPLDAKLLGIPTDDHGLIPQEMRRYSWAATAQHD